MPVPFEAVVGLGNAVLQFALAGVLLYLNGSQAPNRLLALVLTTRGLLLASVAMVAMAANPGEAAYWGRLVPYWWLALPIAILGFASVYPRRRLAARPWNPALWTLGAIALVEAVYFLDHSLWADSTGQGGLLGMLHAFLVVAYPLVGILFFRDYLASAPGRRRGCLLLMSMAFALIHLYDIVLFLAGGRPGLAGSVFRLAGAEAGGFLAQAVTAGALAALLGYHALRQPDLELRKGARTFLGLLSLPVGTGVLASAAGSPLLAGGFEAVWDLVLPLIVTYALLRHQLFDIDLKVKWTIKQSTVAAAFIGVFFVVSEGAQTLLSESIGPLLGIAAAGMLVFAIAPLQRAAERVASAAMPGVRAPGEMDRDERRAFYREHLEVAYRDGAVDAAERALLRAMQQRLGLGVEEAARIEDDVLRTRGGAAASERAAGRVG